MSSQFLSLIAWYVAALAAGFVALPLSFKLFRHLPDRGYTFSKALGLLTAGWVFWFLGSLGFLRNDAPGVLFAALVIGAGGLLWLGRPGLAELRAWLAEQRGLVLAAEGVFLAAFVVMAIIRAHNPEIEGTEKPMEFMFINSILRSPAFPAHDAWLSGQAISYYYFGYVIIAALARATSTASSVAFNLGLSLLFALTAVGAYGVVFNLVALQRGRARPIMGAFWPALLGPFLVLVVGNFYGLAQLAYVNGTFSDANIYALRYYFGKADPSNPPAVQQDANVTDPNIVDPGLRLGPVNFWAWLDLKQTEPPSPAPPAAFTWNVGGNWFYGARVVHDRDLTGNEVEAIDEMPAFSFLLGDMHPHVLALPFVVLATGLALDWLLWGASEWKLESSQQEAGGGRQEAESSKQEADGSGQEPGGSQQEADGSGQTYKPDNGRSEPADGATLAPNATCLLSAGPMPNRAGVLPSKIGQKAHEAGGKPVVAVVEGAPGGVSAAAGEKVAAGSGPIMGEVDLELSTVVIRRSAFVIPFFISAVIFGGLAFLNTWDFPIYLFLTMVAFALGLGLRWGWKALAPAAWRLGVLAAALAVLSVALYFPFYLTFTSQAGGILPNVIWPTRFQQTIVFFGPALIGATIYLAWLTARGRRNIDWRAGLAAGAGIVAVLVFVVVLLVAAASRSAGVTSYIGTLIAPLTLSDALGLAVQRRIVDSAATIFPAACIALCVGLAVGALRRRPTQQPEPAPEAAEQPSAGTADKAQPRRAWRRPPPESPAAYLNAGRREVDLAQPAILMVLAMLLTGALLLIGPEWVYLRDNFGWRMNTIFKFYFQTWSLWSLAAGFGIWHIAQAARRLTRWVAAGLLTLAALGGLVYTGTSLYSKTNGMVSASNLDGMSWFAAQYPDDWAGIQWLQRNVTDPSVEAEAVGGAYNIEESRIAMATGMPTVMGWTNHEGQWRGSSYGLVAERPQQIQTLYQVRDWDTAQAVLDRYQIEYVIIGNEEHTKYNPLYQPKFDQNMDVVFKSGSLTIYRRKPTAAQ
jgi:uncharacterized membrane protein